MRPHEMAPAVGDLPPAHRVALHAHCFDEYLRTARLRQDAWARSWRGRITLAWLQLRLTAGVAAVFLTSLVVAIPIAVLLLVRGWRLRRAVRRSLGNLRALLVVAAHPDSQSASTLRELFTADWAATHAVSLSFVDAATTRRSASLSQAVWKHWRPSTKVPGFPGMVLVRRNGRVTRFPASLGPDDNTPRSDLRAAVESSLLGS